MLDCELASQNVHKGVHELNLLYFHIPEWDPNKVENKGGLADLVAKAKYLIPEMIRRVSFNIFRTEEKEKKQYSKFDEFKEK